jgi:hypothetical protein
VSGVWVCAWIARNWERKVTISEGVKPAVRRRSKPRGAGAVVAGCAPSDSEAEVEEPETLALGRPREASRARSAGERTTSPIEQWM